jgi:hypothetical protein
MSTTTDPAAGREARRARAKATAAAHPFGPPEDVTVADLAVGDFLVMVPSQHGVRGCAVESVITRLDHSWDTWGERTPGARRRFPVPSTQLRFGTAGTVTLAEAGLDVPDTFTCRVRRPRP